MTSIEIKLLIVDDSPLIRQVISDAAQRDPGVRVVGIAQDGAEGVALCERHAPDVITLDVQMPRMDGLETLAAIVRKRPTPILMVSSLTKLGADITLEALDQGAVDCIAKPERADETFGNEVIRRVKSIAGSDVAAILARRKDRLSRRVRNNSDPGSHRVVPGSVESSPILSPQLGAYVVAIGISTGGPPALADIFPDLALPLPPIVIVQHMPPHFTKSFASRLASLGKVQCKEAETGDKLIPGHAFVAQGGKHLEIVASRTGPHTLRVFDSANVSGHKPSVDVMMTSAAKVFGAKTLGVVMTGMGRDGSDGCRAIRAAGGYVLGQDESTSDVYGMNKVAFLEGNVDEQFPLEDLPTLLQLHVRRMLSGKLAKAGSAR